LLVQVIMSEIHDAVREGNVQILTKKLKSSNINGKDAQGQTPLHIAASEGRTEIVKLLLKKKADVNEVDHAGWTPLHCASAVLSREPTTMLEVCDALLDEPDIDAAAQTVDGGTALHYLVRFAPTTTLKDAYLTVLRKVLTRGGSVLHCNKDGEFPIHIASMRSNVDAAQFLLENGAKANILTNKRENSLHYAMMPENSSVDLVQLLLNHGGDKFVVSDKEDSPFTLAKKLKRTAILEVLQDSKPPPLISVVRNNKIQTISTQLKFGQDVNQKDRNGMTPLFHALTTFHNGAPSSEMIDLLLDSGKVDFSITDNQGNTALHYALKTAKLEVDQLIKNMIGKGAHKIIDWENNLGETPLHVACLYRNVKAVKTFLAAAANPSAANQKEETILHYAVLGRSPEIVGMILEYKPNVDLQAPLLGSAVELAVIIKDPQLAELLLKTSNSKRSLSDFKEDQAKRARDEKKKEKEKEEREKKEKEKEEKEKKEKEKEEKDRKKRESKRATLRKDGSQDADINISLPSQVKKLVHVSTDWEWSGAEDPADIFTLEKKVGEGAYGSVYRSIHKASGFLVAIKLVPVSNKQGTDIEKEIEVLKKCRDPNIVSYFGCCIKDRNLWILMEFCGCGSGLDLIKKLNGDNKKMSADQLAAILTFVLKGLNYLHTRGIIHRDLKPANILLNAAGECKLADFGVSATLSKTEEQKAQTSIGTPVYMSPEAIQGEQYDFKTDIWSLGITSCELAQGTLPFDGSLTRIVGLILAGPPIGLKDPAQHSKEFNDFVAQCLFRESSKRKKASELLAHPFITKYLMNDHRKVIKDLLGQYYVLDQVQGAPQERERSATSPPESPRGTMEPSRDPPSLENNMVPKRQSLGPSRSSSGSSNSISIVLPPKASPPAEVMTPPPKEEELELLEDPNIIQAQLALTSTMLDPRMVETLRETVLDLRVQLHEEKRKTIMPGQPWQHASVNNATPPNLNSFLAVDKVVTQQEQMIEALNKLLEEQKKEIELLKLKLVQANQEKNQLASKVLIWKRECATLRQKK